MYLEESLNGSHESMICGFGSDAVDSRTGYIMRWQPKLFKHFLHGENFHIGESTRHARSTNGNGPEWRSGMAVRNGGPEWRSGMAVRNGGPEWRSRMAVQNGRGG
jgi:hypothetical protein